MQERLSGPRLRPRIRLHVPAEETPPPKPRPVDERTSAFLDQLGLSAEQLPPDVSDEVTLPEFFVLWFWPRVMRKRGNAEGTVQKMLDSLCWWRRLTSEPMLDWEDDLSQANDPPLLAITDETLAIFQERLRSALWRRGKLGSWQPLSPMTIAGHLIRLQEVLDRVGPTFDLRKPAKGLVSEPLCLSIERPKCKADKPFTLEEARAIVAAACELPHPKVKRHGRLPVYPSAVEWRTFFGTMFVCGVRISTMFLLRWEWLTQRDDGSWWIEMPGDAVLKTGKEDEFALPEWLVSHLIHYRRTSGPLFPFAMHPDTLDKIHVRLQRGLVKEPMGWNAWRRLLSAQLVILGAALARQAAQKGLNHADAKTTNDSYCDIDNLLRPLLPPLWLAPLGGRRQTLLF